MHLQTASLSANPPSSPRSALRSPLHSLVINVLTVLAAAMVVASLATQANMYCMAVMQIFLGAQFLARHLRLRGGMGGFEKLSVITGLFCLAIGSIILVLGLMRA